MVDQRLVADLPPLCFPAEPIEDVRIDADRDQAACCLAKRWATDTAHRMQLLVRHLGNVGDINPPSRSRTRPFPCRSP
jgi:hypothetical protein